MNGGDTEHVATGAAWLHERDPSSTNVLEQLRAGCPELVDLLVEVLYGRAFSRSRLDARTKCLVAVSCAAAGGFEPQVRYQTRLALLSGVSIDDLYEICFFVASFNGLSNAINAMNLMRVVHAEMSAVDRADAR